jgi:hypothetical protein
LWVIGVAIALVEAKVRIIVTAEGSCLVFTVLAGILVPFIIRGVFTVAKQLIVSKHIDQSVFTFPSVITLVVPDGAGLIDGLTQDASTSRGTSAVLVIDISGLVKVKGRTVGVPKVIFKQGRSLNAIIYSAVQVTVLS